MTYINLHLTDMKSLIKSIPLLFVFTALVISVNVREKDRPAIKESPEQLKDDPSGPTDDPVAIAFREDIIGHQMD